MKKGLIIFVVGLSLQANAEYHYGSSSAFRPGVSNSATQNKINSLTALANTCSVNGGLATPQLGNGNVAYAQPPQIGTPYAIPTPSVIPQVVTPPPPPTGPTIQGRQPPAPPAAPPTPSPSAASPPPPPSPPATRSAREEEPAADDTDKAERSRNTQARPTQARPVGHPDAVAKFFRRTASSPRVPVWFYISGGKQYVILPDGSPHCVT